MALTKVKINLGTQGNLSGSRSIVQSTKSLVSSSAQISTDISGSFTAPSSSFSSRISTMEGSGTAQGIGTSDSPTFNDVTVTGTLTAQEIHTEFESASVLFSSGSTIFGDTSDDIHRMTGSLNVSGGINLNDGNLIVTDKVGIGTNGPIGGGLDILGEEEALVVRTADSGRVGIVLKNLHTGTDVNFTDGLIIKLDSDESGFIGLGADNPSKLLNLGAANTTVMTISGSGQVGIGTNNPAVKLDVNGSALVGRDRDIGSYASDDFDLMVTNANNDATAILLYNDAGAYQSSLIEYYNNKLSLGLNNSNSDDALLTTTAINITSTGVGIGTNNPRYPLVVSGSGQNSYIHFPQDNDSTSDGLVVGYATEGNAYFYNYENSKLIFGTNNAVKMSVNSDGVTIGGTAGAQRALHVQSSTGICLSDGDRGRAALIPVSPSAPNGGLAINIRSGSASHERIRVDYLGNVGINTNSPDFRFHIYNASDSEVFWGQDAGGVFQCVGTNQHMRFLYDNGSSEAMRIKDGGNVGIGSNNPLYKLDVLLGSATHVARFRNNGNNYTMHGILISCGKNAPVSAGDCNYIFFQDGTGNSRGGIRNSSTPDNPEFFNGSDLRMKKDVAETKVNGLETINAIPLKEWNWNSEQEKPKTDIGIVADDLEKVLPELVSQQISLEGWEHCVKDGEEPLKTIPTETKLTLILMKAVQELSKDNDDLKKRIEELEK